jgi:PDZ domain-containing protein
VTGDEPPPGLRRLRRVPAMRAYAGLSRRVRALIVAGVLFIVLFVLVLTMPVPYVVLTPGPTYNTLGVDNHQRPIITITGITPKKTTGHLNMTTVGVDPNPVTAFAAIKGWLETDQVVVPRSAVYPPGQSLTQTNQQNTADFVQSQDDAISAADCQLGYPKKFGVVGVLSDGAAHAVLRPADVIRTLNGTRADTATLLTSKLGHLQPGTKVSLGIVRAGTAKTVSVKLGPPPPGHKTGGSLGITVGRICAAPFSVDLGLANQIGGPSAGLMFALGIMDKVGPTDLTGGRFIAGTGTIDSVGSVGPIGGIALKMIAARDKGATVFLAPAGNCPDVVNATPPGLRVVKVSTLHGAVQDLLRIKKGEPVPSC